jgi:DNA-binding NtrC family response regulator
MDIHDAGAHDEDVDAAAPTVAGTGEWQMSESMMYPGEDVRSPIPRPQLNLKQLVETYERRLILEALERARGNQRRAAAELGVLPTTLNEKMRRLGLRACDQVPPALDIQESTARELEAS